MAVCGSSWQCDAVMDLMQVRFASNRVRIQRTGIVASQVASRPVYVLKLSVEDAKHRAAAVRALRA